LAPLRDMVQPVVQQAKDLGTLASEPNGALLGLLTDPRARLAAARTALNAIGLADPFAGAADAALPSVTSDAARYARAGEDMQTLSSRLSRVAGTAQPEELTDRDWLHTQLLKHQLADLTQERAITAP